MQPDYKEFMNALGSRLKKLRLDRGWSRTDMVVQHGYTESQWRRYETGAYGGISAESLLRIASVFGLTLVELLDGVGEFPKRTSTAVEHEVGTEEAGRAARKVEPKAPRTKTSGPTRKSRPAHV